jgi:hypothetical protein
MKKTTTTTTTKPTAAAKRFETIHATMTKDEKICWSMLSALGRSDEAYRPIAKQVFEGTLTMAQANLWLDTKHGVVQTTV